GRQGEIRGGVAIVSREVDADGLPRADGGGDLACGRAGRGDVVECRRHIRNGDSAAGGFLLSRVIDEDVVDGDGAALGHCWRIGEVENATAAVANQRAAVAVGAAPVRRKGRAGYFEAMDRPAVARGQCEADSLTG